MPDTRRSAADYDELVTASRNLPAGVWSDRIARCRKAMAARGIDVLVSYSGGTGAGGYEWVRYFANYVDAAPLWSGEAWVVIPAVADPALIIGWPGMLPVAHQWSPIQDVRVGENWVVGGPDADARAADALAAVLRERDLLGARIGFGHGGRGGQHADFTPARIGDIVASFGRHGEVVDAAGMLTELVRVKTPYDLAMLRRVAEINCTALMAGIDAVAAGVPEYTVFTTKFATACELGAEVADPEHCQTAVLRPSGPRSVYMGPQRFADGDMFIVDSGCSFGGYESDIARTVVVGTPSADQQRTFDASTDVTAAMRNALRPGVRASGLWRVADEEARRHGFRGAGAMCGHGVGISKHEAPSLTAWDHSIIEANMVINLEPSLFGVPGAGAIQEDTYIVTDDGPERITPLPEYLIVK